MFDTLGRIKELRESRGWSVYRLAKESGISQSTISTWYQKNLCPPVDKIEKICNALDISLCQFFSRPKNIDYSKEEELQNGLLMLSSEDKDNILKLINAIIH